jgi:hypothetical protein
MDTIREYLPVLFLLAGLGNFVRSMMVYGWGPDTIRGELPGPGGPEQSRTFKLTAIYFTVLAIATKMLL